MASSHLVFFGTYTRSTSRGIYAARLDPETGVLSPPTVAAETPNPTWLTLSRDRRFLYAVHGSKAQAIGFQVDAANDRLLLLPRSAEINVEVPGPCHLAVDATNRVLLGANYADGYAAAMPIRPDGTLGTASSVHHHGHGPLPDRQQKPHVHCVAVSPDNRFVFVCDLGLDRIYRYAVDHSAAKLVPTEPPFVTGAPGSGPRHLIFSRDGRQAYNVTEMGATVVVYDYATATGTLTPAQTISTLPPNYQAKWAAEIAIHPNARFLYASNRGEDTIVVFAIDAATGQLTPVDRVSSGGKVPRSFAISPDGHWLVCGHQFSEQVTVFKVDASTGRLRQTAQTISVPMCVSVVFYD